MDVAVVGAGVAGCYVAFRLTEPGLAGRLEPGSPLASLTGQDRPPRISLFEAEARIGGRLWSVPVADGGPPCELGAMRFPAGSPVLGDLLPHLGLADRVAPFPFDRPENLVFLRGVRLRRCELDRPETSGTPDRLPYALGPGEGDGGPEVLESRLAELALPGFSRMRAAYHRSAVAGNREDMTELAEAYRAAVARGRLRGHTLHRLSWRHLLELTSSDEAATYLEASCGYECSTSIGSAASWLDDLFATPPAEAQRCLCGGFQELALSLLRGFESRGGRTRRRHRLLRFGRLPATGGEPAYELTFEDGGGARVRVRARILVLALPRPALERLDPEALLFASPRLRADLGSVSSVGAFKLFLGYRRTWWHSAGVAAGRSTTDLPIRQVYYRDTAAPAQVRVNGDRPGVLGAAYVNGPDVDFWRALDGGDPWTGPEPVRRVMPPAPAGSLGGGSAEVPRPATRSMVLAAHSMLLQLHGIASAPLPEVAFCHDWSAPPHGAGWHVWKPGVRPDEVARRMLRPLPGERVFVVGECWSIRRPGSVPGALVTAESMLREHLRVRPPPWLSRPVSIDF